MPGGVGIPPTKPRTRKDGEKPPVPNPLPAALNGVRASGPGHIHVSWISGIFECDEGSIRVAVQTVLVLGNYQQTIPVVRSPGPDKRFSSAGSALTAKDERKEIFSRTIRMVVSFCRADYQLTWSWMDPRPTLFLYVDFARSTLSKLLQKLARYGKPLQAAGR